MSSILQSFVNAFQGIKWVFTTQSNFRIHLTLGILALAASVYFSISTVEWLAVVLCITAVLSTEILNSATELLVDLISPEWREKAGKIKDMAAAAVLVVAIGAAIIGAIIFLPKILLTLNL